MEALAGKTETVFAGNTLEFKQFCIVLFLRHYKLLPNTSTGFSPPPFTFFQPFDLIRNHPENSFVRSLTTHRFVYVALVPKQQLELLERFSMSSIPIPPASSSLTGK